MDLQDLFHTCSYSIRYVDKFRGPNGPTRSVSYLFIQYEVIDNLRGPNGPTRYVSYLLI